MTIVLDHFVIPERGVFEIDLKQSIEIRVTAKEAQRKVDRWVMEYVSYMMHAEMPTLVITKEKTVWRVPAVYTASQVGRVGTVGTVDIDVFTGVMETSDKLGEQFIACAREMATKLPPYKPGHMQVADEFIPKHIPQAQMAQLPEDDE